MQNQSVFFCVCVCVLLYYNQQLESYRSTVNRTRSRQVSLFHGGVLVVGNHALDIAERKVLSAQRAVGGTRLAMAAARHFRQVHQAFHTETVSASGQENARPFIVVPRFQTARTFLGVVLKGVLVQNHLGQCLDLPLNHVLDFSNILVRLFVSIIQRFLKPVQRLVQVLLDTITTVPIAFGNGHHAVFVALLGRLFAPVEGLFEIAMHSLTLIVAIAEIVLRPRMILPGRQFVKPNGHGEIGLVVHTLSLLVAIGQVELRFGQSLIDGALQELDTLTRVVVQTSLAIQIAPANVTLRVRVIQALCHDADRPGTILRNLTVNALFVTPTPLVSGVGVTLQGGSPEAFEGLERILRGTPFAVRVADSEVVQCVGVAVLLRPLFPGLKGSRW
mmetsp:Transcript_23751/g.54541  ORF Transcript_23751/g.54541 Transcript_23751/m.54541 type:complete len:389 (-) Transcript_23751:434-1600(-)